MDIVFMNSAHIEPPHWLDDSREVMVVVAMERRDTDASVSLLHHAGFASDRVEVLLVEGVPRLEERLGGSGLHRFLVRLRLLRGDDLDLLEPARRELMNGRALVQVTVSDYDEQRLALSLLGVRPSIGMEVPPAWEDSYSVTPAGRSVTPGVAEPDDRPLHGWNPVVHGNRPEWVRVTA